MGDVKEVCAEQGIGERKVEGEEERERRRGKNRIWIKNGIVYDPLNGIEGERKDIFIENGVIVEELSGKAEKILDVSGKGFCQRG